MYNDPIHIMKTKIMPEYEKSYFYMACYYADRGEIENALTNLETAADKEFNRPGWVEEEESLIAIRQNERYQAALREIKEN